MFAEVIVPLPLQGTFSYEVPAEMEGRIGAGSRVLVQFGLKKFHTGIVAGLSPTRPRTEAGIKPITALLDDSPVTHRLQLRLWEWVADYYLCSIGDVMNAAIPSGLKPASETKVSLSPSFDASESQLTESQAHIVALLSSKGPMRISEISKETGYATAHSIVNRMLEERIVSVSENLQERYRPKKETMVRLTFGRDDQQALHDALGQLSRSARQQKLLMAFLELSGWMRHGSKLREVSRAELLEKAASTPGILKGLVDKGIMEVYKKTVNRFALPADAPEPLAELSPAQQKALRETTASMAEKQVTLLHGLTGSGKTEVYTHLIHRVLEQGKSVLYLVPEISLTTQLTDRLRRFFGNRLIVYHSKFSDSERVDIYRRVLESKEPVVVLGARSAVFLPLSNLGLVVVDEEHENSFKQFDPAPRYNARDTSIVLATMSGAKVLLGSATPSIETYWKALNGKYGLVTLSERYGGAVLPEVEVVDMREQRKRKQVQGILSTRLKMATVDVLSRNRQAIMFQNRRGFAPVVVCRQCGWSPKCENCDVSLVYHKATNTMRCHYCGFSRELPPVCPVCETNDLEIYGYGTERIAEEMHRVFDGYRVARMDLDTTRNKERQQEIIEEFANHETDILVGTQMVTKGLDFGGVELVGVLNADSLLTFPDFRANERAFNMLEQVAGRAGRRDGLGKVVIQTTKPDEDVLRHVVAHDYQAHYHSEIGDRERFAYPPFSKIIMVVLKNKDARMADRAAVLFAQAMRRVFGNRVLGPEKPFVSRVATWYLQSIMLKVESNASMKKVKDLLRQIYASVAADPAMKGTQVNYDVDPA